MLNRYRYRERGLLPLALLFFALACATVASAQPQMSVHRQHAKVKLLLVLEDIASSHDQAPAVLANLDVTHHAGQVGVYSSMLNGAEWFVLRAMLKLDEPGIAALDSTSRLLFQPHWESVPSSAYMRAHQAGYAVQIFGMWPETCGAPDCSNRSILQGLSNEMKGNLVWAIWHVKDARAEESLMCGGAQ